MRQSLSLAEARRTALAAQGFAKERPASVTPRHFTQVFDQLGLLQLDSVNVFERSHHLPVLARLGPYDRARFDKIILGGPGSRGRPASHIEYWAHQAAVIPASDWPLWNWRMERYRSGEERHWYEAHRDTADWVLAELAAKGPLYASDLEASAGTRKRGSWWDWSDIKIALAYLWRCGEVVSAGRTHFERRYGLPEQVLAAELANTTVSGPDARRILVERAARALGVATLRDLADYYRMRIGETRPVVRELEEAQILMPIAVEGWSEPSWLHRDARTPRRMHGGALLSPFDPVVWERSRTLRLFDFHYRIEIYTPEPKRVFGYYSLPILLDDRVVGRVDLKSDRQRRMLRVQSAWHEDFADAREVSERLLPLLNDAAAWQGLEGITVAARGNLAAELLRHGFAQH